MCSAGDESDVRGYTADGTICTTSMHFDLILPEDYSTYIIDEPVMVRDHDGEGWSRRYFAGFIADKPFAWKDGATSWSVDFSDEIIVWNQCRRPTKEELGK